MKKINIETIRNIIEKVFVIMFNIIKTIMRIINMFVRRTCVTIMDICDDLHYILFENDDDIV